MQGDILFLHMGKDPIRAGEIVVFNVDVGSYTQAAMLLSVNFLSSFFLEVIHFFSACMHNLFLQM